MEFRADVYLWLFATSFQTAVISALIFSLGSVIYHFIFDEAGYVP